LNRFHQKYGAHQSGLFLFAEVCHLDDVSSPHYTREARVGWVDRIDDPKLRSLPKQHATDGLAKRAV
jgi:hypothetical protein